MEPQIPDLDPKKQSPREQQPREDDPTLGLPPGSDLYRMAWSFYLILAVVAVIWIGVREHGISTALLWEPGISISEAIRSLCVDLGIGLLSAVAIVGVWEVCERQFSAAAEVGAQLRTMLSGLTPGEAIGLALLSGTGEELFFRGALQGSFPGWGGWVGATALFAALHGGPGKHFRWWTLFAGVAGGIMGFWFLARGNLVAPLTTHIGVNGFQLLRAARAGSGSRSDQGTTPQD